MASTHDLVGHLGYKKTYDHLANQFIWPNMTKDIQEYVKTCDSCQCNKESTQLPAGLTRHASHVWNTLLHGLHQSITTFTMERNLV